MHIISIEGYLLLLDPGERARESSPLSSSQKSTPKVAFCVLLRHGLRLLLVKRVLGKGGRGENGDILLKEV